MTFINKNLITLKFVLFFFLSAVGCIFPFLPLHMLHLGLERGEARLISTVAPCFALLGPALLGLLIDKLSVGRGSTGGSSTPSGSGRLLRITTAICLILSAIFYLILLAIPATQRHAARRPQVLFMCDANGSYVMQEVCTEGMRCNRWSGEKKGVLAVGSCEYGCADKNMEWVLKPFSTTSTTTTIRPMYKTEDDNNTNPEDYLSEVDERPPHLCARGTCLVYMRHAARMRVPLSLTAPAELPDNGTDMRWCQYASVDKEFECPVPEQHVPAWYQAQHGCSAAVRCEVLDPYDEPDAVLADADCRRVDGDPATTFWSYLVVRMLADVWPTAGLALLGAACVIATRETSLGRGDVGRQLAAGSLGLVVFPPLAGVAADAMPDNPYLVPIVMHAVFMFIAALILLFDSGMPLSTPEWWWHTASGAVALPLSAARRYGAETAALFALLVLLGTLWSGIDSYLPWTVVSLQGSLMEVGLTACVGALPALPVLFWAEPLVDYIGHSNVFITALIFYVLRFTGLAFTDHYVGVAVCEALEVFTLSLVWVTAVLYFRHLVPRRYTTSGQALPVIAHFCLGRCIGAVVGGLVGAEGELQSMRTVYRALAVCALVSAAVYLVLYHALLAPRCATPPVHPDPSLLQANTVEGQLNGLNTNGASNGSHSPMRVYHEERSKKGHFRY